MEQQAKGIIESFDDVRNVKEYQDKDVDFVYHYRNRPPVMIEVKGDRHKLRNLFAETVVPSFIPTRKPATSSTSVPSPDGCSVQKLILFSTALYGSIPSIF